MRGSLRPVARMKLSSASATSAAARMDIKKAAQDARTMFFMTYPPLAGKTGRGFCSAPQQALRKIILLPRSRRPLQQIRQMLLPQRCVAGGAMAARLAARRYQHVAPALHALDLALQDSELGRVALVVGGVDGDERCADALQTR